MTTQRELERAFVNDRRRRLHLDLGSLDIQIGCWQRQRLAFFKRSRMATSSLRGQMSGTGGCTLTLLQTKVVSSALSAYVIKTKKKHVPQLSLGPLPWPCLFEG